MSYETLIAGAHRNDSDAVAATTFNGSTFVAWPSHADLVPTGNDWTASGRVNVPSLIGKQVLFEGGAHVNGFVLYLEDEQLIFGWTNNNTGEFIAYDFTGWAATEVGVAASIDGQVMSLYVDGDRVATTTHPAAYTAAGGDVGGVGGSTSNVNFDDGSQVPSTGNYLTGSMTELLIFDGALSDAEVDTLHAGPVTSRPKKRRILRHHI